MSPETFDRALSATARIACCVSLFSVACGPVKKESETSSNSDTNPASEPTEPSDTIEPSDTTEPDSAMTLEECEAEVETVFSQTMPEPTDVTAECCQMIAEHLDDQTDTAGNWNGNASMTWPYREVCCELLEWQGSMTCTPWGPPMPPEMPSEHLAALA